MFETRLPGAVARGSVEAESIINRAATRSPASAEQRVAAVLERANKMREREVRLLEELKKAVEKLIPRVIDKPIPKA